MKSNSSDVVIKMVRYVGNHPIATTTPDRTIEIVEMQNAVFIDVNKQAKKEYGEGPQITLSVGERVSNEQAIQIADTYNTSIISISSDNTTTQQTSLLKD
jgi:hypothetical protein